MFEDMNWVHMTIFLAICVWWLVIMLADFHTCLCEN